MSDTSKKSVDLNPKPMLTISGHEGTIYRLTYLGGGERLVTCSSDKTVRIWNVETAEQEGTSMEHDGWIEGLAVTRDDKMILGGGKGKGLRTWDVETQRLIEEWDGDDTTIRCIAMSPDGALVASGHGRGGIIVREMDGGTIKHSLRAGSGGVNALCFSPNGTKLAGGDQIVRVFDVDSGDLILEIEGHAEHLYSVVWSLDGSQLFTGSWDRTIRHWDSEAGEEIGEPWMGHTGIVHFLSLSPDGTRLVSTSADHTVRFWAVDSGDPIGEPLQHDSDVWAVGFSPSGEFVACGGADRKVSIWRVPWWDDSKAETHKSFLDLPAVTIPRPTATNPDRHCDYLDLPTGRRPPSPHNRLYTSDTQSSPSSWRILRTPLHRLFGSLHLPHRRGEVTTVYPGFAQPRVYVASRDDESPTETPTEPLPTAPGHYPGFSIIVESVSSSDSLGGNQATAAPPRDKSEQVQVSCCGLFSRRRSHAGIAPTPPAMALAERAATTSNTSPPPVSSSASVNAERVGPFSG